MTLTIGQEKKPDIPRIPQQVDSQIARQLDEKWLQAQRDVNTLFLLEGPEKDREEQLQLIRDWAQLHEPRITVFKYNHPKPVKDTTYFSLKLYRKRGTY